MGPVDLTSTVSIGTELREVLQGGGEGGGGSPHRS